MNTFDNQKIIKVNNKEISRQRNHRNIINDENVFVFCWVQWFIGVTVDFWFSNFYTSNRVAICVLLLLCVFLLFCLLNSYTSVHSVLVSIQYLS